MTAHETPGYHSWAGMKSRCNNPADNNYYLYGARGISVHPAFNTFKGFIEHVGPRPSSEHSIDRFPNKDGNYEPGNVRWATVQEQARNKRNNIEVTRNGVTKCLSAWAEGLGLDYGAVLTRYAKGVRGDALFYPGYLRERLLTFQGITKSLTDWANQLGMNVRTLKTRLDRQGLSVEDAFTRPYRYGPKTATTPHN